MALVNDKTERVAGDKTWKNKIFRTKPDNKTITNGKNYRLIIRFINHNIRYSVKLKETINEIYDVPEFLPLRFSNREDAVRFSKLANKVIQDYNQEYFMNYTQTKDLCVSGIY